MKRMQILMGLLAMGLATIQGGEVRELPAPVQAGGMPLMEAIATRHSSRDFDAGRTVEEQLLGEILWVAWGQNCHGKRTIPTSRNLQNMQLYLLTPEGAWRYEGEQHRLVKVTGENLIPLCARQDFVPNAPVHLLYVVRDDRGGLCHVGSAYQNVYLYATWRGLSCVVRAMIDAPALAQALHLPADHLVVVHQCLGWPKMP